jgi:hypothetical protein
MFWRPEQPDQNIRRREGDIAIDNREHGLKLDHADGDSFYGPVSAQKGRLEYTRLTSVFDSIKSVGFKVDLHGFNNIGVICLCSDKHDDWRYLVVSAGQHRIAAMTANGYRHVTVQVVADGLGGVVRRGDARFWPSVRHGYLREPEAIGVFDRIFRGKQPQSFLDAQRADMAPIDAYAARAAAQA